MRESTPKEIFLKSVERCTSSGSFIPAFYERFTQASDEVNEKFAGTDFSKQNQMLRRSLELCAGATAGEPDSLREMKERAKTHSREQLDIEPRFYDVWLETIIATARDFDDQWNETVEDAWRRILGYVIKHMVRAY